MKEHPPLPRAGLSCRAGFVALMIVSNCGCVTNALVKHTKSYEWQPQSVQRVFWVKGTNQTPELAVLFDQVRVGKKAPLTRQAVWFPNRPPEPLLVDSNAVVSLTMSRHNRQCIPLFTEDAAVPLDHSTRAPGYAVRGATPTTFTLHADGQSPGPYTLPATRVKTRTGMLLIGTPIALAADAALTMAVIYGFFYDAGAFPSGCN